MNVTNATQNNQCLTQPLENRDRDTSLLTISDTADSQTYSSACSFVETAVGLVFSFFRDNS